MSALQRITDAASEPVTTVEAKAHLHLDNSADDTLVDALIIAARMRAEALTDRAFVKQTWRLTLDRFPPARRIITIPKPPLIAVTSISYIDPDGATQTLTTHQVDARSEPGRIRTAVDTDWPTVKEQTLNAVTITFTAGYDESGSPTNATDNIPAPIKQAILLIVGDMFEQRENVVVGTISSMLPFGATNLLAPYVVYNFNF